MKKLTLKEEAFVNALFSTAELNQTEAAAEAYKTANASTLGSTVASRPHVKAEIDKRKLARSKRTDINADWLLNRLAAEAEADVSDLYFESGAIKPVHMWPKIWRQGLVVGIDVQQLTVYEDGQKVPDGFVTKLRFSDRIKRLELIGKHVNVKAFESEQQDRSESDLVDAISRLMSSLPN